LRVRELHPAVEAYETSMSLRPPAELQVPVLTRARGSYENPLGTCHTCN
jgi:hypothetical protein